MKNMLTNDIGKVLGTIIAVGFIVLFVSTLLARLIHKDTARH